MVKRSDLLNDSANSPELPHVLSSSTGPDFFYKRTFTYVFSLSIHKFLIKLDATAKNISFLTKLLAWLQQASLSFFVRNNILSSRIWFN